MRHAFAKPLGHGIFAMDQDDRNLGIRRLSGSIGLVLEGDNQIDAVADKLLGGRIGRILIRKIAPV